MDDLISRQAALEKVRTMQTYKLFMGDDMILVDKAEVQTELMMLPSVQPEVLACGNGELVAKPEPQWIPVSERLPRDGSWNIFTDGKNISVERYKADAIDHFFPNGRWFQLKDVIAWMPLPEAYKEGGEKI